MSRCISSEVVVALENSTMAEKSAETCSVEELMAMKHPLEHEWSLWLYINDKNRAWQENLVELHTFNTVEDFWCLYHHIKQPSELRIGQDYALFKKGIRPEWEDVANGKGGRWIINFERKHRSELDRVWLDIVLLLIGENFSFPEEISGAVVNIRGPGKDKICLWTTDIRKQHANMDIGKKIREHFDIQAKIGYQDHKDSKNKYGSTTKYLYTV